MPPDLHTLPFLAVDALVEDGTATFRIRGDLDASTITALSEHLAPALAKAPGRLVFDLADLGFIDCAGARTLADAARALPGGQRPVLRSPSATVLRLLHITGLDMRFTIEG